MRLESASMVRSDLLPLLVEAAFVRRSAESIKHLDSFVRRGSSSLRFALMDIDKRNSSGATTFKANLTSKGFVMQGDQNP